MGRRRGVHSGTAALLRTLSGRLRLERLRQLWMQCELFSSPVEEGVRAEIARPAPPRPDVVRIYRKRRSSRSRADDAAIIGRLQVEHAEYNATLFDGELGCVKIRLSRRMKNRLPRLLPRECVVGVVFSAGCLLPVMARTRFHWNLAVAAIAFAALAWLNVNIIGAWFKEWAEDGIFCAIA